VHNDDLLGRRGAGRAMVATGLLSAARTAAVELVKSGVPVNVLAVEDETDPSTVARWVGLRDRAGRSHRRADPPRPRPHREGARMSTAVVTGAARGIGRAIAVRLASEGHRLVLVDMAPELAETALGLEREGIDTVAVQVDLVDDSGISAVADVVGSDLVLVVNNAGITRDARLINLTDDDFGLVIDVNLGAAYRLTRALVPAMIDGGAVVNLASRAYLGNFGQYNYSMSKGAMVGMTRALALELAPAVRVNAVAPGLIGTEMSMGIPEELRRRMVSAIPLDRMGRPEEVAELVAFLGSDRSSYITGQVVVIGGGRSFT
jgi:3-oxoacyl-[acyl-carrier protein] reductase